MEYRESLSPAAVLTAIASALRHEGADELPTAGSVAEWVEAHNTIAARYDAERDAWRADNPGLHLVGPSSLWGPAPEVWGNPAILCHHVTGGGRMAVYGMANDTIYVELRGGGTTVATLEYTDGGWTLVPGHYALRYATHGDSYRLDLLLDVDRALDAAISQSLAAGADEAGRMMADMMAARVEERAAEWIAERNRWDAAAEPVAEVNVGRRR